MANPNIKINTKKLNPSLKDLLDMAKKDIFLSLNCHAIGTVQEFDQTDQTASVTMNYVQSYAQLNADGTESVVSKNYPVIVDAPVMFLGGGSWNLTFPVSQGDTCLIFFNDRDIDNWFQSGQVAPCASTRLHSFADAIILVGLRSSQDALDNFDLTRAILQNSVGGAMVGVADTLIRIANNTTTLNTLLQSLITAINAIKIDPGTLNIGGTAVTGQGQISTASQSALSGVGTNLGGLLE